MTTPAPNDTDAVDRGALVRRAQWLSRLSLGFNAVEAIVSIAAGVAAGSISLLGFGIDSVIEMTSSVASLWRLRSDADPSTRARAEKRTLRIIGASFLALAAYVAIDAAHSLWMREHPERSMMGIAISAFSAVSMPILARRKRAIAITLGSVALEADAMQTDLCMYLSVIVLGGLALNAAFGWWWADPVAALAMLPIIAKEGVEGVRGEEQCEHCGP